MPRSPQRYSFGFADSLLAELAGVPQSALHTDVDAICRAYDAIVPMAERLGVPTPKPRLAGLAYNHVSTLGCPVTIKPDCPEPEIFPCIRDASEIDRLTEPSDYLVQGIVPQRLATLAELKTRRPDATDRIGHDYEGPITTAVLLMGQDFFMLPHDNPARAHRLLEFCVRSAVNYASALRVRLGLPPFSPGSRGIPDDFAGIFGPDQFGEFVVPYWDKMYRRLQATSRGVHSELIREAHLPFLKELQINVFDPSVDQYLTPEILARSCPVPFALRIWPSQVIMSSASQLVALYRHLASFRPNHIIFGLERAADEPKIAALLGLARELA